MDLFKKIGGNGKEKAGETIRRKVKTFKHNADINRKMFYKDNLFFFNY